MLVHSTPHSSSPGLQAPTLAGSLGTPNPSCWCAGTSWRPTTRSCGGTPTWRPSGGSPGCLGPRTLRARARPSSRGVLQGGEGGGCCGVAGWLAGCCGRGLNVEQPGVAALQPEPGRLKLCRTAGWACRLLNLCTALPVPPVPPPPVLQVPPAALPVHTVPGGQRQRRPHHAPPILRVPG